MARLNRSYIIVERTKFSSKKQGRPEFELVKAPRNRTKTKKLARKLSGGVSDVAWVADNTRYLYKGGEARIEEVVRR